MVVTMPNFNAAAVCLPFQFPLLRRDIPKGPAEKLLAPKNQHPIYSVCLEPDLPLGCSSTHRDDLHLHPLFSCAVCTQLHWYSEKNAAMTTVTTDGI